MPSANVGPSRKRNTAAPAPVDKASQSLNKQAERNENVAVEDERVEISVDGPTLLATSGNDDESDEDELLPANGIKAFKQRDLVAEAFAADNVVEVSGHPITQLHRLRLVEGFRAREATANGGGCSQDRGCISAWMGRP